MSKFNGRKIARATMHETVHTPETGEIKKTLSAIATMTDKALDMELQDPFVAITTKGTTVLVPLTNFKSVVLAKEVAK